MDLLDINRILGERPFPPSDAIKDYLREIELRREQEKQKKIAKDANKDENNKENKDDDNNNNDENDLKDGDKGKDEPEPVPVPEKGFTERRIKEAEKVMDKKSDK